MQVSDLLQPMNDHPVDEPKILIRFAPFLTDVASPTAEEVANFLNRTDKVIFFMLAKPFFSLETKDFNIPLRDFAVILWKVSLLRRNTNKGRKYQKQDEVIFKTQRDTALEKSNLGKHPIEQFLNLSTEQKEQRCLRTWKNLRKYVTFFDLGTGWSVTHEAFKCVDDVSKISNAIGEILPRRLKDKRRLTKKAVVAEPQFNPLLTLANHALIELGQNGTRRK